MPVIRLQQRISELDSGDLLAVLCTDPGTMNDIPAWCRVNGHELVELRDESNEFLFVVKVGGVAQ